MGQFSVPAGRRGGVRAVAAGVLWLPLIACGSWLCSIPLLLSLPIYAATVTAVGCLYARFAALPAFGYANSTTLVRCGLIGVLLAAGLQTSALAPASWRVFFLALAALLLDLADGWIARRFGETSRFGRRFDLETDTAFLFVLSFMLTSAQRVGPWVLAVGMLRPLFVLCGHLLPALARPLAPSRRRAAVCGLSTALLVVALAPPVSEAWAARLSWSALFMLAASFAIDVRRLLRDA